MHGLPSSHLLAAPAVQVLLLQASPTVHALLSSHVTSLARYTQPVASLQVSSVHGLLSAQLVVVPMQLPFRQASLLLQLWPSSHALPSKCRTKQPVAGSQPSAVHGLVSLQSVAVLGAQRPATQVSPEVQALPSLQSPSCAVWVQPDAMLQESAVQLLPSSHPWATPAVHVPFAHRSPPEQTLPSSHVAVFGRLRQPELGSQESSVHTLPSEQSTVPCTAQAPAAHLVAVHALPSSQVSPLFVCTQPVAGSHLSSVQTLLSSQSLLALQPTSGPIVVSPSAPSAVSAVSVASFVSGVSMSEPAMSALSFVSLPSASVESGLTSGLVVPSMSASLPPTCTSSVPMSSAIASSVPMVLSPQPVSAKGSVQVNSTAKSERLHRERSDLRAKMFIVEPSANSAINTTQTYTM